MDNSPHPPPDWATQFGQHTLFCYFAESQRMYEGMYVVVTNHTKLIYSSPGKVKSSSKAPLEPPIALRFSRNEGVNSIIFTNTV